MMNKKILINLKKIKWIFLDVDGVLTDGRLFYTKDGEEIKVFHVHDGYGIQMIRSLGIQVGVISGRGCPALEMRLTELGVDYFILNRNDKREALNEIASIFGSDVYLSAHIGDDIPDLKIFENILIKVAVKNAVAEVANAADICLSKKGGYGAVREFCDMVLDARKGVNFN